MNEAGRCRTDGQDVAPAQRAAFEASESTQKMSGGAAKKELNCNATLYAEIAARAGSRGSDLQLLSGSDFKACPEGNGVAVQSCAKITAGKSQDHRIGKREGSAEESLFQSGRIFGISNQPVA